MLGVPVSRRFTALCTAGALFLGVAVNSATAETPFPTPGLVTGDAGRLILAGHNPDIPAAVRRAMGRVTAVGAPNEEGNILSFTVDIADLAPNELRSWRITFVSGELYAYVFQVRGNEGPVITVTSLDGPLNGLAVGDGLLIEQTPIDRPTPQMRTPPAV
jgi:hypothetical protein